MSGHYPFSILSDELKKRPDHAKKQAAARRRMQRRLERYKATLGELRQARHVTQVQLAKQMQSTQPEVSRIEKQADVLLSTMRDYIEAMGGQLELLARFPDGPDVIITIGEILE